MNPFTRSDAPQTRAQARPTTEPVPVIGQPVMFAQRVVDDANEPWYARTPKAFTVLGIDVHVSPLLFVYVGIILILSSFAGFYLFFLSAVGSLVLFGTVLVHELGHCQATRSVGGTVSHILLWPLGGLAYVNLDSTSAKGDLWVAVAGPLTHIPMFLFWLCIAAVSYGHASFIADAANQACWLNVYLMAFNLFIPAYPLDGSRILTSALAICGASIELASAVVIGISAVMSLGLLAYGIYFIEFLPVFVASYTGAETYKLWSLRRQGTLQEHPTFMKYGDRSGRAWTVQAV